MEAPSYGGGGRETRIDRNSKEQPHRIRILLLCVSIIWMEGEREEKGAARGQPRYALRLGGDKFAVMPDNNKNLMLE